MAGGTLGVMTDPYAIDWDSSRDHLRDTARNDAEWNALVATRLVSPSDRLAVDVGCGGAGMAIALARALPTDAAVLALDGSAEVLEGARENARSAEISEERLAFRQCDLHGGLAELRTAVTEPVDLVWASASVHHVGDQQAAINQLASLLSDSGRLALAEGGLPSRRMPWDVGVGRPVWNCGWTRRTTSGSRRCARDCPAAHRCRTAGPRHCAGPA
jgi:SAM-dependent methyltransferase